MRNLRHLCAGSHHQCLARPAYSSDAVAARSKRLQRVQRRWRPCTSKRLGEHLRSIRRASAKGPSLADFDLRPLDASALRRPAGGVRSLGHDGDARPLLCGVPRNGELQGPRCARADRIRAERLQPKDHAERATLTESWCAGEKALRGRAVGKMEPNESIGIGGGVGPTIELHLGSGAHLHRDRTEPPARFPAGRPVENLLASRDTAAQAEVGEPLDGLRSRAFSEQSALRCVCRLGGVWVMRRGPCVFTHGEALRLHLQAPAVKRWKRRLSGIAGTRERGSQG
eukprot:scaffold11187_cov30-Tisochrysis_lutea.AAC.10